MQSTYQAAFAATHSRLDTKFGAPMGRANVGFPPEDVRIYDRALPMCEPGYDKGGAYWGIGPEMRVRFTADLSYVEYYRLGSGPFNPQWVRVYDNGGETLDRYTIIFPTLAWCAPINPVLRWVIPYVSASQTGAGVYMHGEFHFLGRKPQRVAVRHLGKRVPFYSLDKSLQSLIKNEFQP